jgi:hypothetical protein
MFVGWQDMIFPYGQGVHKRQTQLLVTLLALLVILLAESTRVKRPGANALASAFA